VDPRDKAKGELSRFYQVFTTFIDSIGYCLFTAYALLEDEVAKEGMLETACAMLGVDTLDLEAYGMNILEIENDFNKRAGFTKLDDRLPDFFYTEPLPPTNEVFDVPESELKKVFEYSLHME
jgi:aldehyde:ferredoxin oxidoreductase